MNIEQDFLGIEYDMIYVIHTWFARLEIIYSECNQNFGSTYAYKILWGGGERERESIKDSCKL